VFLAFGDVITLQRRVLELSGYTARVAELEELLLGIDAEQARLRALSDPHHRVAECIEFSDADIVTPDGFCLVQGLTVRVPPRQHLLLTGPNTSGKSSLLRVLEDLWPLRRGYCSTPVTSDDTRIQNLFLVPQVRTCMHARVCVRVCVCVCVCSCVCVLVSTRMCGVGLPSSNVVSSAA
jgi:ABC-type uncharacterized transport system fused permease/ATPase subunit